MMRFNKALALLLAAALLVLLPGIARAEKEFKVEAVLFADRVSANSWNRLDLRVENNSTKDFQGSVLVELQGEYLRDVFVEAGKTVTLTLYLPPLGYRYDDGVNINKISLLDQRGREVSQASIATGTAPDTSLTVGIMAREYGEFRRISNVLSYLTVRAMNPRSLDFYQFSLNYRAIIISNPDAKALSPEQSANLRRWLEAGGLLIVGGGSGWQQSAAPLPSDLLPVRVQGVESVAAGDLSSLGLPSLEEGNYTIAVGETLGDVLISSPGGKPLLVAKKVGKGNVLWSALDLEAAPLLNAANAEAFWQRVFLLRPLHTAPIVNKQLVNQLLNGISQDSLAAALSPGKLFLLLLGYIILVGPVNWLVLRKIDRREWAWFVIPAVALVLTAGSFAYGRIGRGSDAILYQVNIVDQFSPREASVESYGGVLVPSTRKMTLSSDAYLVPFSQEVKSRLEDGRLVLGLDRPPLWSVQNFVGAKIVNIPGGVDVEATYNSDGERFEAKVTNNSGQDFFASFIKAGNDWLEVGPLASGETRNSAGLANLDIHAILSRYNPLYNGWFDFSALAGDQNMYFLGFADSGQLAVEGAERTVALDIWLQSIDTWDILAADTLNIPRGILTPQVQGSTQTDMYMKDYHYYSPVGDSVDLVFSLPDNIDYSQGEFTLHMDSLWGDAEGKVLAFNYKSQQWQELTTLSTDSKPSGAIVLKNMGELVFENSFTVRIDYTGSMGFYLEGIGFSVFGGRTND